MEHYSLLGEIGVKELDRKAAGNRLAVAGDLRDQLFEWTHQPAEVLRWGQPESPINEATFVDETKAEKTKKRALIRSSSVRYWPRAD